MVIGFMAGIMFCALFFTACGSYLCRGRGRPRRQKLRDLEELESSVNDSVRNLA